MSIIQEPWSILYVDGTGPRGDKGDKGDKGDVGDVNPQMPIILEAAEAARDAAKLSASAATQSADNAQAGATTATQQVSLATTAADTATTQAGIATTQAGIASASAIAASGSADTATTQAGIATTQAGIATGAATTATTQAGIATTQASNATTSANNSATSASQSAGSAAQALAIYSNTAAMQTAVSNAQAAASLAGGHAASASSVVQQDLSGVNAAALHRSPNAVTAMFVYDTSKDSDGGAWTEKCQHTSWYNEPINGKWLGPQPSEAYARNEGATLGAELVSNGTFDSSTTGWATTGSVLVDASGVTLTNTGATYPSLRQTVAVTSGKVYRLVVKHRQNFALTNGHFFSFYAGGSEIGASRINFSNTVTQTDVIYITAPAGATEINFQINADNQDGLKAGTWDNISVREVTAQTTQPGDYFQLTTDGRFYRLNATSGTTEVFRGNKRDFPRLSAIVAEGATSVGSNNIAIYDLTEPGRPMWMAFRADPTNKFPFCPGGYALRAISMLNGELLIGGDLELFRATFPTDRAISYSSVAVLRAVFNGGIGNRMSALGYTADSNIPALPGRTVNAIAMTALPDAPIDPVTGLRIPTIAVATNLGISIIQPNGTVRNSSSTLAFNSIAIAPALLTTTRTADGTFYWAQNPSTLGASFALQTRTNAQAPDFNTGNTAGLIGPARNEFVRRSATVATVQKLRNHESDPARALAATITNTHNTGHQTGDIRRCFLSDTSVGLIAGASIFSNLFTPDRVLTSGMSWYPIISGASVTGGILEILHNHPSAPTGRVVSEIDLVEPGKTYLCRWTVESFVGNATASQVSIGTDAFGNGGAFAELLGVGSFQAVLQVPVSSTTHRIALFAVGGTSSGFVAGVRFSEFTVEELVSDRSYKAQGATITGTLTKSEVAAAAQLVAYSGFSASNYAQEPYHADLDFGTGEWSASAWVNVPVTGYAQHNLWTDTSNFTGWSRTGISAFGSGSVADATTDSTGAATADLIVEDTSTGSHEIFRNQYPFAATVATWAIEVKAAGRTQVELSAEVQDARSVRIIFDLTAVTVTVTNGSSQGHGITDLGDGWRRIWYTRTSGGNFQWWPYLRFANAGSVSYAGDGTSGVYVARAQFNRGTVLPFTTSATGFAPLADRDYSTGPAIKIGIDHLARLQATAFDGTTTRTVTSTAAYNTATWLKARVNYTTDGTLALLVNGVQVAAARGNPLLTLNNASAVLTIGNSFALDAPFPGSIALLKLSATVPTAEQAAWMYEQEKHLFQAGAQCCLPDAGSIADLTYDEATDKWIAISATNESEWSGLVRTSVTAVPAGSYTRAAAGGGVQLLARSTTTPGVDVTIPAYGLREELVKRAESAARLNAQTATYDYVGGFTANTTNGNTAILSIANLTYPTRIQGARVTGTGIPANASIADVSGTTGYLSAAATATGTAVQINLLDFALPTGLTATAVSVNGVVQREGPTAAYTRLFDGFREVIRFAVAPGNTAWVQIQTVRSAA